MKIKTTVKIFPLVMSALMVLLCGCSQGASSAVVTTHENLLAAIQKSDTAPSYDFTGDVSQPDGYDSYVKTNSELALNLLKSTYSDNGNTIISPLSVTLALGMLENGAGGDAQKEIKKLVGGSTLTLDNVNQCSAYLTQRLTAFNSDESFVGLGNSLWVSNTLSAKRGFLQKDENYFGIPAYTLDFSDKSTNEKITNLTASLTNNTVQNLSPVCDKDSLLYMVSTAAVKSLWVNSFTSVKTDNFTNSDGSISSVDFLNSVEHYISTDNAQGFVKSLDNIPCKFVALVPNSGSTLQEVLDTLNGTALTQLSTSMLTASFANICIPQFSADAATDLKEQLSALGVTGIFESGSDLTKLADGDVFVNAMTQQTAIAITRDYAGVADSKESATADDAEQAGNNTAVDKNVSFNQPFLYAVVDNESGLPIVMGTVTNLDV